MVVAHSLGAHVLSNHIWDAQKPLRGGSPASQEALLESEGYLGIMAIARVLAAAPNIMLFVAGRDKVQPFDKPSEDFEWHSFYNNDDVLGWPLHQLPSGEKSSYENLVAIDRRINVGGLWASWNPASHTEYLRRGLPFVKHVAEEIEKLHGRIT